jgi:hypothetical protein
LNTPSLLTAATKHGRMRGSLLLRNLNDSHMK